MPPKSNTFATEADKKAKWCKADDRKLQALISQEGNNINLGRDKDNIKRIHKHWPQRDYKNFATLIRGKLEKFEIERILHGKRRSK